MRTIGLFVGLVIAMEGMVGISLAQEAIAPVPASTAAIASGPCCPHGGTSRCPRCGWLCHRAGRIGAYGAFNCSCSGSYNYPVPPLYTYHWPGMYKQGTMVEYRSPYRYPMLRVPSWELRQQGLLPPDQIPPATEEPSPFFRAIDEQTRSSPAAPFPTTRPVFSEPNAGAARLLPSELNARPVQSAEPFGKLPAQASRSSRLD